MDGQKAEIIKGISQKVYSMADEIFQTIQELVRIPSTVGHEGEAQEWMAQLYKSLGLGVIRAVPRKEKLIKHPLMWKRGPAAWHI